MKLKHPEIIKAYDIRGVWGENLVSEDIACIAECIIKQVTKRGIVYIGMDGRASSPSILHILYSRFIAAGIRIVVLGVVHTPLLYFVVTRWTHYINNSLSTKFSNVFGIMITGSHNPANHNGMKIMVSDKCLDGADIKLLLDHYHTCSLHNSLCKTDLVYCNCHKRNISTKHWYIKNVTVASGITKCDCSSIKVAWDPGNGAISTILPYLLGIINSKNVLINDYIDSDFRSRSPNPLPQNLTQLQCKIIDSACNFGFAFDGDGDRIVAVMGDGRILNGGELLYILACDLVQRTKNLKVIVDVKIGEIIVRQLRKIGVEVIFSPTGHSLIKRKMLELNVPLAGEASGHIYYRENYYPFEDPLYVACIFMRIYTQQPELINSALNTTPIPHTYTFHLDIPRDMGQAIIYAVRDKMDISEFSYLAIDGIRCTTATGYWLVRCSNTEDLLMVIIEEENKETLYKSWAMVYKFLSEAITAACGNNSYGKILLHGVENTKPLIP